MRYTAERCNEWCKHRKLSETMTMISISRLNQPIMKNAPKTPAPPAGTDQTALHFLDFVSVRSADPAIALSVQGSAVRTVLLPRQCVKQITGIWSVPTSLVVAAVPAALR